MILLAAVITYVLVGRRRDPWDQTPERLPFWWLRVGK